MLGLGDRVLETEAHPAYWAQWLLHGALGLDWIGLDWIGLDWIGLDWLRTAQGCFLAAACAFGTRACRGLSGSMRLHLLGLGARWMRWFGRGQQAVDCGTDWTSCQVGRCCRSDQCNPTPSHCKWCSMQRCRLPCAVWVAFALHSVVTA